MPKGARGAAILIPVLSVVCLGQASTSNWENVKAIAAGAQVRVVIGAAKPLMGTLESVTDTDFVLTQGTGPQSFARARIASVSVRKRSPPAQCVDRSGSGNGYRTRRRLRRRTRAGSSLQWIVMRVVCGCGYRGRRRRRTGGWNPGRRILAYRRMAQGLRAVSATGSIRLWLAPRPARAAARTPACLDTPATAWCSRPRNTLRRTASETAPPGSYRS